MNHDRYCSSSPISSGPDNRLKVSSIIQSIGSGYQSPVDVALHSTVCLEYKLKVVLGITSKGNSSIHTHKTISGIGVDELKIPSCYIILIAEIDLVGVRGLYIGICELQAGPDDLCSD